MGDSEQGNLLTLREAEYEKWTRDEVAQIDEGEEKVDFLRVDILPAYFPLVTSPALRLFIYMASRREGLISYLEIQEEVGIRSKTTIRKGLEELEALGWVELKKIDRDEKGKFGSLLFCVLPAPKNLRQDAAELYKEQIARQKARLNKEVRKMAMRWKSPTPINRLTAEVIRLWLLHRHRAEWYPHDTMKTFTLVESELPEFVSWLNEKKALSEVTVEDFKPFVGFKASPSKKFRNYGVLLDDCEGKLTFRSFRSPVRWLKMYIDGHRF